MTRGVTFLDKKPKLHSSNNDEDAIINFGQQKKFQRDFQRSKVTKKFDRKVKEFVINRADIEQEEFEASTRASVKFKKAFTKRKVNK